MTPKSGKIPGARRLFLPEIVLLVLGGGVLLLWGAVAVTDSPVFCGSLCHSMAPYHEAWKRSHHRSSSCVTCHDGGKRTFLSRHAPGMQRMLAYLARGFTDPMAVGSPDRVCLAAGCHDQRLLVGAVTVQGTRVHFDHQPHLAESRKGLMLRCTTCHASEVMGISASLADRDPCFLCHLPREQAAGDLDCLTCHPPRSLSPGPENLHRRMAGPPATCRRCHPQVTWQRLPVDRAVCAVCHGGSGVTRAGVIIDAATGKQPDEIHRIHINSLNVRCSQCHLRVLHRPTSTLGPPPGGPPESPGPM